MSCIFTPRDFEIHVKPRDVVSGSHMVTGVDSTGDKQADDRIANQIIMESMYDRAKKFEDAVMAADYSPTDEAIEKAGDQTFVEEYFVVDMRVPANTPSIIANSKLPAHFAKRGPKRNKGVKAAHNA